MRTQLAALKIYRVAWTSVFPFLSCARTKHRFGYSEHYSTRVVILLACRWVNGKDFHWLQFCWLLTFIVKSPTAHKTLQAIGNFLIFIWQSYRMAILGKFNFFLEFHYCKVIGKLRKIKLRMCYKLIYLDQLASTFLLRWSDSQWNVLVVVSDAVPWEMKNN